ncbi:MAG: hypothetical protein FJX92_01660 [Bacteroidetes bacterium]|nr:hypothetical protein [Bacteroidota bacterium]
MSHRFLLLSLLGLIHFQARSVEIDLPVQSDTTHHPATFSLKADDTFNQKRFLIIGGSTTFALAGSYFYLKKTWWSEGKTSFHFDGGKKWNYLFRRGRDWKYAKNLDKAGHFYGGVLSAGLLAKGLDWAGVESNKRYLWSGIFGTSIQGFIEYKDGFSPRWGFSVYDLLSGSLGSFYPYFQSKSKLLSAVDIKFSYFKRNSIYEGVTGKNYFTDDYINQTYWLTFNPHRFRPTTNWPKWLGVSVGFGVDDRLNLFYLRMPNGESDYGKGGYEFYLAPDLDFSEILPKRKRWQQAAKILNFIKVPAPTLRLSNDSKLYLLYF